MILQAGYDCFLTQSAEVPMAERVFENHVLVSTVEDMAAWKEVTRTQKEEMQARTAFIDVDAMDVEAIGRVGELVDEVTARINTVEMTAAQALEVSAFFPEWESLIGQELAVGFRLRYGGTLYEVIQAHTAQSGWIPGTGTESLYKVVQVEHEGTADDPIPWAHNMVLEEGKHYTDKDVLYLCIRDSVIGLSFDLADLVSGGYVEVVTEGSENENNDKENNV